VSSRIGLLVAALSVALAVTSTVPAVAQCVQGGCQIGPCTYSNLLYDHNFESPSCGAWVFTGYTSRPWEADNCSTALTGYEGYFYGLANAGASGVVYQDIDIPSSQSASDDIGFYVDIQGSSASWWDRLYVTLRDPATNEVLESLVTVTGNASTLDCQFIRASVQGNYAGQTVRLYFESVIWTGADTRFVIDNVNYWHTF